LKKYIMMEQKSVVQGKYQYQYQPSPTSVHAKQPAAPSHELAISPYLQSVGASSENTPTSL
jgi:hypothetical protein